MTQHRRRRVAVGGAFLVAGQRSSTVAKESKARTWQDYHEEIEALKERRSIEIRKHIPDDVQEQEPRQQRMTVLRAENHPSVLALTGEIAMLREEQMSLHEEPPADPGLTEAESDASHVAHGHAPRFGTMSPDQTGQ